MDKNDQRQVNKILHEAVGMRLYRVYRAEHFPCIVFAEINGKNEDGDFHIHAQCPVRFAKNGNALLAVNDMHLPGTGITKDEFDRDCDERPISRYDEIAKQLEQAGIIVKRTKCTLDGDLLIDFSDGSRLTVFPIGSDEDEEWRLIDRGVKRHTVYHGNGFLEVDEV